MAIEGVSATGLEAQSSQTDAVKSLIRWESPHPLSIAGVKENGLHQGLVPDGLFLLDGRNRLAIERAYSDPQQRELVLPLALAGPDPYRVMFGIARSSRLSWSCLDGSPRRHDAGITFFQNSRSRKIAGFFLPTQPRRSWISGDVQ